MRVFLFLFIASLSPLIHANGTAEGILEELEEQFPPFEPGEPLGPEEMAALLQYRDQAIDWSITEQARLHQVLASVYTRTGDLERAYDSYSVAIEILERLDEPDILLLRALTDRSYVTYLDSHNQDLYCPDRLRAVEVARRLDDPEELVGSLSMASFCFQQEDKFGEGVAILEEAMELVNEHELGTYMEGMIFNAASLIHEENKLYETAYEYSERAYNAWDESGSAPHAFNMQFNLVRQSLSLGDVNAAARHVALLDELAENHPESEDFKFFMHLSAGRVHEKKGEIGRAIESWEMARDLIGTTEESHFIEMLHGSLATAYFRVDDMEAAEKEVRAIEMMEGPELSVDTAGEVLAVKHFLAGEYRLALNVVFDLLSAKRDWTAEFAARARAAQLVRFDKEIEKYENQVLQQELEIRDLELREETSRRQIAVLVTGLALMMIVFLVYFALSTRHRRKQSDALLGNILPADTITELKKTGKVAPRVFRNATVLFTDIKGFTVAAREMAVEDVVSALDQVFSAFDIVVDECRLEKIKTIGDAYMCVAGVPDPDLSNEVDAILASAKFIYETKRLAGELGLGWTIRIGVHSGPLIAGVVGTRKPTYDIWGNTVNLAARVEAGGASNEIIVSRDSLDLAKDFFELEDRGQITTKEGLSIPVFRVVGPHRELMKPSRKNPDHTAFEGRYKRYFGRDCPSLKHWEHV